MITDTFNEMILGFSVIFGALVIYVLSLIIRFKRAMLKNAAITEEFPKE